MALTIYGFHDRPHDFAVTKAGVPLGDCDFLLDFNRPLNRLRWLGFLNAWVGPTVALMVPVVHQSEENGEFVISVKAGQPYFVDLPKYWKEHYGSRRTIRSPPVDGIQIVGAFGFHFPEDAEPPV